MTTLPGQSSVGRFIVVGIVAAIVTALAVFGVMKAVGAEANPAVVGGIAGAVAGGLVPVVLRRKV